METKTTEKKGESKADFSYIVIYLFTIITGAIFFLISGNDKRKKQHSIQAMVLGVIMIVIGFIPYLGIINIFLWLYGLYIGYKASLNEDVAIPYITDFAKSYA
ncbi:MAG: hypothetical protein ACP5HW_03585 [Candidatus Micrarchaeia archaeon]